MKFYVISLLISVYVQTCYTARILGVFPYPSPSQHIIFRGVMEELAKQGHHIVVMTPNPAHYKDKQFKNITEIDVQKVSYDVWNKYFDSSKLKPNSISTKYTYYAMYKKAIIHLVDAQLDSPQMKKLLDDKNEHFDLVFSQHLTPIMFPIADHFKAPLIVMTLSTGLLSTYDALGNPYHPVFYPDGLSPYDGKLNILQKVDVVGSNLWQRYNDWSFSSSSNRVALKHFGPKSPTIEEAEHKIALLFTNNNPILAGIRPLVPAIIYLGGVHFKQENNISKELTTVLDRSQKGVIYVSLGNDVRANDLSAAFISTLTDTFAELPYDVIWKWDNDTLASKPSNVYVSKWLPQQDILAHPNVRLFITQAGQLSMEEAIHYKVPMIGIPFILDQERNAKQLDKFNIGINLGELDLDKDILKSSIFKVMNDNIYKERIEWFSELLADQPDTGLERAVWWTEYVLRHNGADHLRAPTMPLYEYLLLDIIATLIVGAVAAIYSSYTALRLLLETFCKPKTGGKLKKS